MSSQLGSLRDRILAAAAELIEERGAERVPLEEIAARAGVETAIVAVRHPDVASLVEAMVERFQDEFPRLLCRFASYEEPERPRSRGPRRRRRRLQTPRFGGPQPGTGCIRDALAAYVEERGAAARVALGTERLAWLRRCADVVERVRRRRLSVPPAGVGERPAAHRPVPAFSGHAPGVGLPAVLARLARLAELPVPEPAE